MTTVKTTQLSKMDNDSKPGPDWYRMLYRFLEQLQRQTGTTIAQIDDEKIPQIATNTADTATAQTAADTAQTSADNAGTFWVVTPASQLWNTDTAGVHEAGNPTQDSVFTLRNKDDTSDLAVRTLKGTMTTASGNITVTNVSSSGLTTVFVLDPTNNADPTVKATVTATFADGSKTTGTASWSSVDETVAGGTPVSGLGK